MPGVPLVLGPFPGGVNNRTDPGSIDVTELNECTNFIYGVDGTLIGRWPITEGTTEGSLTEPLHLLGSTVIYDTSEATHSIVVGSNNPDGTWIYESGVWHKISNNEYKCFVAYGEQDNRLYFPGNPDDPTQDGGSWGYVDAYGGGALVEDPDTPVGSSIVVHKERIWITGNPAEPSTLYYSITTPQGAATGDWDRIEAIGNPTPAGIIEVEPGNGQGNVCLKAYADAIVIFKNDSTYVLSYDGNFSQGQLIQVNGDIGTENNETVVEYQNILVVYHEGKMYAYGNGSFQALNDKFRFLSDDGYVAIYTFPISLSAVGDFILVRHYDKIFCYNFITGGWGEWTTEFPVGNFVQIPHFAGDETKTYFITSIDSTDTNIYRMYQTWNTSDTEDFVCFARTKVYNFDAPYVYKRLFWWGIEALTNLPLTGTAQPVSESYTPTWEEVATVTWGDVFLNTWGSMFSGIPDVVTGPIDAQQGNVYRRMYKFLKGLRFREISFRVDMVSDGSSINGPPRLLSVVPIIKAAETVVKQVS